MAHQRPPVKHTPQRQPHSTPPTATSRDGSPWLCRRGCQRCLLQQRRRHQRRSRGEVEEQAAAAEHVTRELEDGADAVGSRCIP